MTYPLGAAGELYMPDISVHDGATATLARTWQPHDMTLLYTLPLAWLALAAALLFIWRKQLSALWREPVFTAPILIVESDDWGAGPVSQAEALINLADCLSRHHDARGRPAVMTLALVLALPKAGMAGRVTLADAEQQSILAAINAGRKRGVFALQLHGLFHFWPDAVTAAARTQAGVAAWLEAPVLTETLPSHLQSRWTDAGTLPSRPHAAEEIVRAVAEETALFAEMFGDPPEVVVPPTFIWTDTVEAAWAAAGVRTIITPGQQLTHRDSEGRPSGGGRAIRNGEQGTVGVFYLVRDDYFEPIFGHQPEQAVASLANKALLGRPCLLETHRWNFLASTGGQPAAAMAALEAMYIAARRDFPTLRFVSCAELALAIRVNDPDWIEQSARRRFTIWLRRVATLPRFGKAARMTGLLPILNLFA